tara:strand:- start:27300 stop:27917 length:618 start_codon:yes stop_codon:yes gene_type:complete
LKNILLFFLSFVYLSCTAQNEVILPQNQIEVDAGIFKVLYSEFLEQPLNVKYKVLCPEPGVSRDGMNFYRVDSIHTSNDADYYKNVWDKGHMAPAAAFNCTKEMLIKTFSYLNSSLQHQSLNRGEWRLLEEYERELVIHGYDINVEIEILFDTIPKRVSTNAAIPKAFKKHLWYGSDGQHHCFYFLNEAPKIKGFENYKIECNNH